MLATRTTAAKNGAAAMRQQHGTSPTAAVFPAACVGSLLSGLPRVASGQSFASFGEIIQGRLSGGDDFLVTLPVELWSTCRLVVRPASGPVRVDSRWEKSGQVAHALLRALGVDTGVSVALTLARNIPVGKGLSSSTADMLAVLRAFQNGYGITLTPALISALMAAIEPHDALHYDTSVAYNHRQGQLLKRFAYVPDFQIVGVDSGGELSTLAYNRRLSFTPQQCAQYDALLRELYAAFARRDDAAIARCAGRSAQLHAGRTDNQWLQQLLSRAASGCLSPLGLGIVAAHSGTCAGVLLPGNASAARLRQVAAAVADLGQVFHTRTLRG